MNDERQLRRTLFGMVFVGFAIRVLVVACTIGPYLEPDNTYMAFGYEGGRIAESIVRGDGFANPLFIPTGPTAWRVPVYPYLMAGFFGVFGTDSLVSAILMYALNCFFSAVTSIPIFKLGQITFSERVGKWAGWIWAFFPYAIVNATQQILDTPISVLLVPVLLVDTLRMQQAKSQTTARWIWHGTLWAFSALTHTGVIIVMPFYWLWILYRTSLPWNSRVRLLAAASLTFVICVAPWMVRNYLVFGKFVFFRSNLAMELYVGNQHGLLESRDITLHPTTSIPEARRMQQLGEIAYLEEKKQFFLQFVKEHPGEFATRSVRRVFHYWFSIWEYQPARLIAKPFETADIPFATLFSVLGFLGLWQLWRRDRFAAFPYAAFLALYPLVFYVTHRSYRYRHPVDPVLVLLGAAALVAWRERRRAGVNESGTAA